MGQLLDMADLKKHWPLLSYFSATSCGYFDLNSGFFYSIYFLLASTGWETNLQLLSINQAPAAESSAMKALLVLFQSVHIRGDFAAELAGDRLGGQVLGLCVLLIGGKRWWGWNKERRTNMAMTEIFLSFHMEFLYSNTKRHFFSVSDPDSLITDQAF